MPYGGYGGTGTIMNLQANLAAMTSMGGYSVSPHHPLTCTHGDLFFDETGRFGCEHVDVPSDDPRTQSALDATVAILIVECLDERLRKSLPLVQGSPATH